MEIICENEVFQFGSSECFWVMVEGSKKHKTLDDDEIQNKRGIYVFFNHEEVPIRIGKAVKLRNRILSYYSSLHGSSQRLFEEMADEIAFVSVIYTERTRDLELRLINLYKPKFNKNDLTPFD